MLKQKIKLYINKINLNVGKNERPFPCAQYVHKLPFASTGLYVYKSPSMILQASPNTMQQKQLTSR